MKQQQNTLIMKSAILRLFIALFAFLACHCALATEDARPVGGDSRIKIISYKPNTVFKFVGHYEYQSIIEFSPDETIDTITMGTPTPWQIIPSGNRIFIKPVDDDATTNMTVITNKRMYFFEMHAEEVKNITDSNLSFVVKFVYPEQYQANAVQQTASSYGPDLTKPELYNFDYTISGDAKTIEPLQVFDDGRFTYIKFRDVNAEIPAVFRVNSDNTEAIINFRFQAGYVIVEQVAERFTLRSGTDVICLFNKKWYEEDSGRKRAEKKATIF